MDTKGIEFDNLEYKDCLIQCELMGISENDFRNSIDILFKNKMVINQYDNFEIVEFINYLKEIELYDEFDSKNAIFAYIDKYINDNSQEEFFELLGENNSHSGQLANNENEDIIIADWNKLPDIVNEYFEDKYTYTGFDDEYITCDDCNNIICLTPQYYGDIGNYHFFDDYVLCKNCILKDSTEYIEQLIDNYAAANTILSFEMLENLGFIDCYPEEYEFENGFHPGQNDNPKEIMNKAMEEFPNSEFIFHLKNVGQFDTHFRILHRSVYNEE